MEFSGPSQDVSRGSPKHEIMGHFNNYTRDLYYVHLIF